MIPPDASNKPVYQTQSQIPVDWFNETYSSYCAADYVRAQAAATMYMAEGLEALRLWCRMQSGEITAAELEPPGADVTK